MRLFATLGAPRRRAGTEDRTNRIHVPVRDSRPMPPKRDDREDRPDAGLFRDHQRQDQAYNECARFKSAKKEHAQTDCDEQRFPNLAVAGCSHEQVQRWTRPLLVDEMKESLIQVLSFKCYALSNRTLWGTT